MYAMHIQAQTHARKHTHTHVYIHMQAALSIVEHAEGRNCTTHCDRLWYNHARMYQHATQPLNFAPKYEGNHTCTHIHPINMLSWRAGLLDPNQMTSVTMQACVRALAGSCCIGVHECASIDGTGNDCRDQALKWTLCLCIYTTTFSTTLVSMLSTSHQEGIKWFLMTTKVLTGDQRYCLARLTPCLS